MLIGPPTYFDVALSELHGNQLSSVTFVQDYLQLHFDGPLINVLNPILVASGSSITRSGESEFRNRICEQIAKKIEATTFMDSAYVRLQFEDSSYIEISLKAEDYIGPEALNFCGNGGCSWIVI